MRKGFANIILLVGIAVLFAGIGFFAKQTAGEKLGATILTTALTDTINTLRTNVNTSLTNLNEAVLATTTNPGHFHSSSSIVQWGVFATSSLGNASATNITASGYFDLTGKLSFGNASGSNITATGFLQTVSLRSSGVASLTDIDAATLDLTGNSNVSGTLNVTGATAFQGLSLVNGSSSGNFQVSGNLLDAGSNKYVTSTGSVSYIAWTPGDCSLGSGVTLVTATSARPFWQFDDGNASMNCNARVPSGVSQVSSTFVYFLGQSAGSITHFGRWAKMTLGGTVTTDEPAGSTTTTATADNTLQRILPQATGYDTMTGLKEDDVVGFEMSRSSGDSYVGTVEVYYIVVYFK